MPMSKSHGLNRGVRGAVYQAGRLRTERNGGGRR